MYTLESSRRGRGKRVEAERKKGNLIMSTGFSLISLIFSPEKNFEKNQERTNEERREGETERKE